VHESADGPEILREQTKVILANTSAASEKQQTSMIASQSEVPALTYAKAKPKDRFFAAALVVAFLLLTGIVIAVGYLGLNGMERLNADAQGIADTQWEDVRLAFEALDDSNQSSRITTQIVMAVDLHEVDSLLTRRAQYDVKVAGIIQQLKGRIGSEREKELLTAVIAARTEYHLSAERATDLLSKKGEPEKARILLIGNTYPRLAKYHVAWSEFIRFQTAEMNQQLRDSSSKYYANREKTTLLIVLAVLLALGITAFQVKNTLGEIRRRTRTEGFTRRLNESLECMVLQRTAALDETNQELMAEIRRRKQVEESLVLKTAFLEAQANSTVDGILVVDGNNRKLLQNQMFIDLFQVPPRVAENEDDSQLLSWVLDRVSDPEQFAQRVKYLYEHLEEKSQDEITLKNGQVLDRYSAPVIGIDGKHYGRIWSFRDISDRKLAEKRAQFLAYYDALTRLPNRLLLRDRLGKALSAARRRHDKVALLFLDLDRFKIINDSLGHSVGDLLLQDVALRLQTWARDQDTVARVGGDEFLIVLTAVKEIGDVAVAAQRIVDLMRGEFVVQNHTLSISCSIGISLYPEHGVDEETLIKNADAAMYDAKDRGRRSFRFFTEAMNAQVVERLTMENSLRSALDQGELSLVYQPQMDLRTGSIMGLEALLRWRNPVLGLVPPDKFIRIAENSGLIIPIGEWVLRTACSQARAWQEEGFPALPVAVNVSAVQFRQEGFGDLIRRVLHESQLEPKYLEVELTESVLLSNEDLTFAVLHELKNMGLKLAIDDFGTGYSSLHYLRTFPVSRLKIDRSFIQDIPASADDEAITVAIISMARSLKLRVIAEGVETEAQVSFLREHQCDEIQGHYFSEPLSAKDVATKLEKYKPLRSA
jgi:diguanylate cyclase (GGDEF)-like protein